MKFPKSPFSKNHKMTKVWESAVLCTVKAWTVIRRMPISGVEDRNLSWL